MNTSTLPIGMPHNMGLLMQVFAIQNPSEDQERNNQAMNTIAALAPESCTIVRSGGNMLIRKGPSSGPSPFYVAHMDQVHDYVPSMRLRLDGEVLSARDENDTQCGVGGDDKCGIYVALMMLHALDHCTAVFFRDEEVGCLGSRAVPLSWFDHAAFAIQADRNNTSMDIITRTNGITVASPEFAAAMLGLPIAVAAGHTEAVGTSTDIGQLARRDLRVSMANISSGYHHAHCPTETVRVDQLGITLQLAYEAALLLGTKVWTHTPSSAQICMETWW